MVPGPSDFPVRYRMLTSWGYSLGDATLAVTAGGVFNIGIKLVLPVIAAVGLLVSDTPVEGPLRTIVAVAALVGLGLAAVAAVLASERAHAADRAPHRPDLAAPCCAGCAGPLATTSAHGSSRAGHGPVHTLRDPARRSRLWGTFLTALTRFGLLLLAVRFTGSHRRCDRLPAAGVGAPTPSSRASR